MKTLLKNDRLEIALAGRFLESEGGPDDAAREVRVLIIKEGMGNKVDRHFYSGDLLTRTLAKFDGLKAYADHPTKTEESDQPERSVRQIVGHYHSPKIVTIDGRKAIEATLKIISGDSYSWAWDLVKEASAFAKKFKEKEFVGISINAWGKSHQEETADGIINFVDDFSEVQSADIVTQAGAGGGFRLKESGRKLLEAVKKALHREAYSEGDTNMNMEALKKHGEALKTLHDQIKGNPDHAAAYGPACEALMASHAEMMKGGENPDPAQPPKPNAEPTPEAKKEAERQAELAKDEEKLAEAYKANKLDPIAKKLYEDRLTERAAAKIEKDRLFVEKTIREAAIPEAYAGDLPALCLGKSEAEVKTIVETRKKLLPSGNRASGAGAGAQGGGKGGGSKMAEKLAASGVKMKEVKA